MCSYTGDNCLFLLPRIQVVGFLGTFFPIFETVAALVHEWFHEQFSSFLVFEGSLFETSEFLNNICAVKVYTI